jgi:hypothetical protein
MIILKIEQLQAIQKFDCSRQAVQKFGWKTKPHTHKNHTKHIYADTVTHASTHTHTWIHIQVNMHVDMHTHAQTQTHVHRYIPQVPGNHEIWRERLRITPDQSVNIKCQKLLGRFPKSVGRKQALMIVSWWNENLYARPLYMCIRNACRVWESNAISKPSEECGVCVVVCAYAWAHVCGYTYTAYIHVVIRAQYMDVSCMCVCMSRVCVCGYLVYVCVDMNMMDIMHIHASTSPKPHE